MRIIGMDIHRVAAEMVLLLDGEIVKLGRIPMLPEKLEEFARTAPNWVARACENREPSPYRKPLRLDPKQNSNQTSTTAQVMTKGSRLQIGTPAGMKSEWVAGDCSASLAGFVGIRTDRRHEPT